MRKKKKGLKLFRLPSWTLYFLRWLVIIGVVVFLLWSLVYLVVLKNPVFRLREIESNISLPASFKCRFYGKNIFRVDLPKIYDELKGLFPLAKKVQLIRDLPNRLVVRVDLRKPIMFVRRDGIIFPIDEEGFVLKANMSLPRDVIELKIDPDISLEEGIMLDTEAVYSAIALWRALKKTGFWDMFDFEYIDAYQPYELRLKIRHGPVWKFRGGNYEEKLNLFKKRLLPSFLSEMSKMGPGSYVLFLEDGTITVNPS